MLAQEPEPQWLPGTPKGWEEALAPTPGGGGSSACTPPPLSGGRAPNGNARGPAPTCPPPRASRATSRRPLPALPRRGPWRPSLGFLCPLPTHASGFPSPLPDSPPNPRSRRRAPSGSFPCPLPLSGFPCPLPELLQCPPRPLRFPVSPPLPLQFLNLARSARVGERPRPSGYGRGRVPGAAGGSRAPRAPCDPRLRPEPERRRVVSVTAPRTVPGGRRRRAGRRGEGAPRGPAGRVERRAARRCWERRAGCPAGAESPNPTATRGTLLARDGDAESSGLRRTAPSAEVQRVRV